MRHGLVELVFKVHRGLIAERAVEPRAVIKDFDPFKDRGASLGTCREVCAVDQTAFERAPKTFHERVVVTVAAPADAGNDSSPGQSLAIGSAGVLHAPIGVVHQTSRRPSLLERHLQSGQWQSGGQRVVERPTDAAAGGTNQHTGYIKTALTWP